MTCQSPSNGSGCSSGPDPAPPTGLTALREATAKRGHAGYRYLRGIWPLLALGAVNIAIVFASNAPAIYVVAVALGTLGIAIGVRVSAMSAASSGSSGRVALRMRDPRVIFWTLGAVLHLFLLIRVFSEPTNGYDIVLWAAGIAAFGAPFLNLNNLRNLRFHPPVVDVVIVIGLVAACIALHSHDLRDWYYAAIGDEIGFYLRVRQILESGIHDPFAFRGVYHNSPMLNSVYQAAVSWFFGGSAWGWKFSSILSIAITLPAVYWLGYLFAGRIAAIVGAAVLASSHYVMAFTHIGYTNLDALPVIAWAVLAFILGNKRKSGSILFAAGVIAGLGLYAALPARIILPIFAVWILAGRTELRQLVSLWPAALGFTVSALPFLVFNGGETISGMGLDIISTNTIHESQIGNPIDRIFTNLGGNLISWWWNPHASHYTSGSLLDAASGLLMILGIGVAVGKWRATDKFLIAWLVLTMIATAVFSPYETVPITRMHSNLIPIALLAGVGVSECLDWIKGYRTYKYVAVGALLIVILALNIWRFQVATPDALPHYSLESMAIKAWHSDECGRDNDTLFIGRDGHLMDLVLLTYLPEGDRPMVVEYDDPLVLPPWPACKIFFRPDDPEARQRLQVLSDVFSKQSTVVSNPSGHTRVEIVK